jgi:hypothetical protein
VYAKTVRVVKLIRHLRGETQPMLVEASDGLLYVVKSLQNPRSPSIPFNEAIGSELYLASKLSVPKWKPLLLTEEFVREYRICRPDEKVPLRTGLAFGTWFLPQRADRVLEILPASYFPRIRNRESFWVSWVLDVCMHHTSRREVLFLERSGFLQAVFIDHSSLFGSLKNFKSTPLSAGRYIDSRIYDLEVFERRHFNILHNVFSLDADQIWRTAQSLPTEWKVKSALQRLSRSLNRLSSRQEVIRTLEQIVARVLERIRETSAIGDQQTIGEVDTRFAA